jgi:diguanylate cyclase (GGDEF)-like protein/PAS domain S-box-containing protein
MLFAILGSLAFIALTIYARQRRSARGGRSFAILIVALAVWSIGHGLQIAITNPATKALLVKIQYLGVLTVPPAWLVFALEYTNRETWITWRNLLLLAIEPLLTLIMVWINPFDLMWKTRDISETLGDPAGLGPWNFVNRTYAYLLLLAGVFLLFRMFMRSPRFYRRPILALLIGALAPFAVEVLALTGVTPWPEVDLTGFALTITAAMVSWGFFNYRLLDIVPAARDAVIESMIDGVIVLDGRNRIVDLNPAAVAILGQKDQEVIGQPASEAFPSRADLLKHYREVTEARVEITLGDEPKERIFDLRISPFSGGKGRAPWRLLVLREITERKRAEMALRESEERYALAAQGANDGLWDWDLKSDRIYLSTRWKAMLNYEESEIGNHPDEWFNRIHAKDIDLVRQQIQNHLVGLTPTLEIEHRILHKDGKYRWVLSRGLAVRDTQGRAHRIAGSLTDITERKIAEEKLVHDALHDRLTGLHNRAMFADRLVEAFARARRRSDFKFAVIFLDLDRFKVVNDSLGHAIGDLLLIAVADRLKDSLRRVDTLARFGGDEFAILLEEISGSRQAVRVAERVMKALKAGFELDGHQVFTSASIGVALGEPKYSDPQQLLRDADIAMYRAKQLGRSQYVVFDREMHVRVLTVLQMEADLRRALERREFELHYQPIVFLESNKILGLEALLRWRHPKRGLLAPSSFLAVAEESSLILPIGYWVLRQACRQLSDWQSQFPTDPPLTVSVNLTGRQLRDPHLIHNVKESVREADLHPGGLILEITERAVMDNNFVAVEVLKHLKALGVQLHMDDYGARNSSLDLLTQSPIDSIKIDRSFVSNMASGEDNLSVVRTIVNLGHSLKKGVIAEGIETPEDLQHLRELECDYGQGHFFSKPMPPAAAEVFVQTYLENSQRIREPSKPSDPADD